MTLDSNCVATLTFHALIVTWPMTNPFLSSEPPGLSTLQLKPFLVTTVALTFSPQPQNVFAWQHSELRIRFSFPKLGGFETGVDRVRHRSWTDPPEPSSRTLGGKGRGWELLGPSLTALCSCWFTGPLWRMATRSSTSPVWWNNFIRQTIRILSKIRCD